MKLLAGIALFLLCAITGEGKARRLQRREKTLSKLCELLQEIGERQQRTLVSFQEGALMCPPSPEPDSSYPKEATSCLRNRLRISPRPR